MGAHKKHTSPDKFKRGKPRSHQRSGRPGQPGRSKRPVASGRFEWIGGIHAVDAVLRATPEKISRLCFARERGDKRLSSLMTLADSSGVAYERIAANQLESRAGENNQGVAALAMLPGCKPESDLKNLCQKSELPLFLVLDQLSDPRNFGACLRTAEACGVTAVVVSSARSPQITPVVLKSSSGAAARVPVVRVGNLVRALKDMKSRGVWMAGLGGDAADDLYQLDCRRPLAYVLGAEGTGLRRLTRENCDHYVRIPMCGAAESLNVSVAAAVCLYEAVRQR